MKSMMPWGWNDSYFKPFFEDPLFARLEAMPVTFPRLDMEDRGHELVIRADVPGVEQKDLGLEVEEDRVIIQGKTEAAAEEKGKNYYRRERKSGSFYRMIPLPCRVDGGKAQANFKNGVLEISLPKLEDEKEKRVKVKIQ